MLKLQGYTIKEKINRNLEVEIHRAIDPNNRDVVIKYIPYTSSKQALNNLKKEYDFIHSLSEDSVIKTFGFISWEEGLTLILEDGGISLKEYCKKHGKLSITEFLDLSIRLTKIISFLHKNRIVHKDIKPSNFVIFLVICIQLLP